jgi:hypothetical protein
VLYSASIWNDEDYGQIEHHRLMFERAERERLFFGGVYNCFQRNGGEWCRVASAPVLCPEVDRWVRARVGHALGEYWSCDRIYYPDEELPVLPTGGRGSDWRKAGMVWNGHWTEARWGFDKRGTRRWSGPSIWFRDLAVASEFKLWWG